MITARDEDSQVRTDAPPDSNVRPGSTLRLVPSAESAPGQGRSLQRASCVSGGVGGTAASPGRAATASRSPRTARCAAHALSNDLRRHLHHLWLEIPPLALTVTSWQTRVAARLARAGATARVRIARDGLSRVRELTRTINDLQLELAERVVRARTEPARRTWLRGRHGHQAAWRNRLRQPLCHRRQARAAPARHRSPHRQDEPGDTVDTTLLFAHLHRGSDTPARARTGTCAHLRELSDTYGEAGSIGSKNRLNARRAGFGDRIWTR